jgi:hypothetical protein
MSEPEPAEVQTWEQLSAHGRRLLMYLGGATLNDHGDRWPEQRPDGTRPQHSARVGRVAQRPQDTTAIRRSLERRSLLEVNTLKLTAAGYELARWAISEGRWPAP